MTRHLVRRNVLLLAICQGLLNSTMSISIAVGGLVGYALAADKSLATLPVTTVVTGTALATIPASLLMGRFGRRAGFMMGAGLGAVGALLAALALWKGNFWGFAGGTMLFGMASAFGQQYRFAAADVAPPEFKSRAISLVMAGGVVAGFAGPEIAKHTKDLIPSTEFLGVFLAVAGLFFASLLISSRLAIPRPSAADLALPQRSLGQIMRQPVFVAAAASGMIGYAVMSLVMTATPLAMVAHDHAFDDAATVIQWHVVGMFAPSFVTGSLIARFGVGNIILTGVGFSAACVAIALSGTGVAYFWLALLLLGIGWNFMFIGGTTLLTEAYNAAEKPKAQAANEFLVFGSVALASLSSGHLLHHQGWDFVLYGALPFLVFTLALIGWYFYGRAAARRAV